MFYQNVSKLVSNCNSHGSIKNVDSCSHHFEVNIHYYTRYCTFVHYKERASFDNVSWNSEL